MGTKLIEFELHDGAGDYVYRELPVEWSYSFNTGKYSWPPEDCYPASESIDIWIEDVEQVITNINPSVAIENILTVLERLCELHDEVPEWANEEADAEAEARGEALYEAKRERELWG